MICAAVAGDLCRVASGEGDGIWDFSSLPGIGCCVSGCDFQWGVVIRVLVYCVAWGGVVVVVSMFVDVFITVFRLFCGRFLYIFRFVSFRGKVGLAKAGLRVGSRWLCGETGGGSIGLVVAPRVIAVGAGKFPCSDFGAVSGASSGAGLGRRSVGVGVRGGLVDVLL